LGTLLEGPRHGYDIQRQINADFGDIWRLSTSQVYSVLKRLERDGLVTSVSVQQGARPPRKIYRITPQGRERFLRWALSPQQNIRELRVEFLGKVALLMRMGQRDQLKRLIDAQKEICEERLQMMNLRMEGARDELERLVVLFRVLQIRSALEWLRAVSGDTNI
jgi:DNA-binding PadR family transcriptional regulator